MKQNILGQDLYTYAKTEKKNVLICISIVFVAVAVNIICVIWRSAENHYFMLVGNILTDFVGGSFLIYIISEQILPGHRRYRLLQQPKTEITGQITFPETSTLRYMDINCYPVMVNGRRLFLPDSPLQLTQGQVYTLYTVSNMIVEVAV